MHYGICPHAGHNIGSENVAGVEPEAKVVVPRVGPAVPRPVGAPLLDLEPPQTIPQPILPQQSASPVSPTPVSHQLYPSFFYFILLRLLLLGWCLQETKEILRHCPGDVG